ncbi:hypothetical protein PO909_022515 [Leuciscus waleckii]
MMVKQHMLFTLYSICGIVLKGAPSEYGNSFPLVIIALKELNGARLANTDTESYKPAHTAELEPRFMDYQSKCVIDKLTTIRGNTISLIQPLHHLIGNFKYTHGFYCILKPYVCAYMRI